MVSAQSPENFSDKQAATLRRLRRHGGAAWRAYGLKEAPRAVFQEDLTPVEVGLLLDRSCSKAQRSGLKPFVTMDNAIRTHRAGILAAVRLTVNNARHEALNRRIRMIVSRLCGLHSANAALALVMLTVVPVTHVLPQERAAGP